MDIIVTVCAIENDCILMVREGKKKAYGLWNLPSGHLEPLENIFDGALREVREETGYNVEITGLISIHNVIRKNKPILRINLYAVPKPNPGNYDSEEIMEVKWIPVSDLMSLKGTFRSEASIEDIFTDVKHGVSFPLSLLKNINC